MNDKTRNAGYKITAFVNDKLGLEKYCFQQRHQCES